MFNLLNGGGKEKNEIFLFRKLYSLLHQTFEGFRKFSLYVGVFAVYGYPLGQMIDDLMREYYVFDARIFYFWLFRRTFGFHIIWHRRWVTFALFEEILPLGLKLNFSVVEAVAFENRQDFILKLVVDLGLAHQYQVHEELHSLDWLPCRRWVWRLGVLMAPLIWIEDIRWSLTACMGHVCCCIWGPWWGYGCAPWCGSDLQFPSWFLPGESAYYIN